MVAKKGGAGGRTCMAVRLYWHRDCSRVFTTCRKCWVSKGARRLINAQNQNVLRKGAVGTFRKSAGRIYLSNKSRESARCHLEDIWWELHQVKKHHRTPAHKPKPAAPAQPWSGHRKRDAPAEGCEWEGVLDWGGPRVGKLYLRQSHRPSRQQQSVATDSYS